MDKEVEGGLVGLEARFWIGNRRASELWSQVGPELRRSGWTWPLFLRLLRLRPDLIVLFELGKIPFDALRDRIREAAESDIGAIILKADLGGEADGDR